MAGILKVKNWEQYQHYPDGRRVVWIKLHRSLLDDATFHALPDDVAVILVCLWLVAAEHHGTLPHDPAALAWRIRRPAAAVEAALGRLVGDGLLEPASDSLEGGKESASLEENKNKNKSEKERRGEAAPPTPASVILLRQVLEGPAGETFEGLLRSAHRPESFAAAVRAFGPGGTDGRYTWAEVGQGLLEAAATNGELTPRKLAGFLRRIHEAPAGPGGTEAERMAALARRAAESPEAA